MMSRLHREDGDYLHTEFLKTAEVQSFIQAHAEILDSTFSEVEMSDTMRKSLQASDYIFSGMKTFHELNEAFPSLLDDDGQRKPFGRFYEDVRTIDSRYNRNYLRAEYNFAHAAGHMAARWEQIERDGDRYDLQYRTAGDDKVRASHAALDGVTLPPSDPFWKIYYPPNGWNCRCTAVQVRKDKYPRTPSDEAMLRGAEATANDKRGIFRFNAGQQRKVFPDYNPYTIQQCRNCDVPKASTAMTRRLVPNNQVCAACKLLRQCEMQRYETLREYPNGGKVSKHELVSTKNSDYKKLVTIAEFFASQGKEVRLTPKMSRPAKFVYEYIYESLVGTKFEGKCPDLWVDGVWYEHEGYTSVNPKNAFRNMLNDGLKQSDRLVIDKPHLTNAYMKRVIKQRIKDGQTIKEIWIIDKAEISSLYKKSEE